MCLLSLKSTEIRSFTKCFALQGKGANPIAVLLRGMNLFKGIWALIWLLAFVALANSKALLGSDMFGGPIWLIAVGVRLVCLLLSEGILSPCGCTRANPLRRFFMKLEKVYLVCRDDGKDAVLGWKYVSQPLSRSIKYYCTFAQQGAIARCFMVDSLLVQCFGWCLLC